MAATLHSQGLLGLDELLDPAFYDTLGFSPAVEDKHYNRNERMEEVLIVFFFN
jgi:hypothetical protein